MSNRDMVSKAEVLDIYAELYDEFDDAPGVIKVLHKVCDKLTRLQPPEPVESLTINGWISVKDRMPDKQTPVLVYVPPYSDENEEYIGHVAMSYYTHSAHGGYWAGTDGNVYGAIGIIHEPTYWMPLPKPPEKEK